MSSRDVLCFVITLWTCVYSATIGDGKTSLYTGKAIDPLTADGRCQVENEWYAPETLIPRVHPCHYCLCYAGKVDCYWKSCGTAPENCQILAFEDACNPSLYVCSIPEQARSATPAPVPKSIPARQTSFSFNQQVFSDEIPKPKFMNVPLQSSASRPKSPNQVPLPAVYLQPPALATSVKEVSLIAPEPAFQEFGQRLRKRQRGRLFRRSVVEMTGTGLRLPIDEEFPVKFDAEFVANLEREIRHKRAINATSSFGLNGDHAHHHHAHDHEHTVDKGCNILGVRYELGEVIGVATDVCQECRCAAQSLYCSPKCCFQPTTFHLTPASMARGNELPSTLPKNTRGTITSATPRHPLHSVLSSLQA